MAVYGHSRAPVLDVVRLSSMVFFSSSPLEWSGPKWRAEKIRGEYGLGNGEGRKKIRRVWAGGAYLLPPQSDVIRG